MSEREQLLEWLLTCPVRQELNFDDYEIMSINFLYTEENDEQDTTSRA